MIAVFLWIIVAMLASAALAWTASEEGFDILRGALWGMLICVALQQLGIEYRKALKKENHDG